MFLIQPEYSEKEKWQLYAKDNDLKYEILEFSTRYLNSGVPKDVLKWYRDSRMAVSVHGVFMDNYPISPDSEIRALSRKRCEESCRYAEAVGADNIIFHSTALAFVRKGLEKNWGEEAADYYQYLADRFHKNIFIENFSDVDFVPMLEMMKHVTDPRVKLCLDAGHVNYSRVPMKEWLQALNGHIGYLHLSDNHGKWDDHELLGEGSVELKLLSHWWCSGNKQVPITIEVKDITGISRSLDYLKHKKLFISNEVED